MNPRSPITVADLPTEMMDKILKYLLLRGCLKARAVCKLWNDIVDRRIAAVAFSDQPWSHWHLKPFPASFFEKNARMGIDLRPHVGQIKCLRSHMPSLMRHLGRYLVTLSISNVRPIILYRNMLNSLAAACPGLQSVCVLTAPEFGNVYNPQRSEVRQPQLVGVQMEDVEFIPESILFLDINVYCTHDVTWTHDGLNRLRRLRRLNLQLTAIFSAHYGNHVACIPASMMLVPQDIAIERLQWRCEHFVPVPQFFGWSLMPNALFSELQLFVSNTNFAVNGRIHLFENVYWPHLTTLQLRLSSYDGLEDSMKQLFRRCRIRKLYVDDHHGSRGLRYGFLQFATRLEHLHLHQGQMWMDCFESIPRNNVLHTLILDDILIPSNSILLSIVANQPRVMRLFLRRRQIALDFQVLSDFLTAHADALAQFTVVEAITTEDYTRSIRVDNVLFHRARHLLNDYSFARILARAGGSEANIPSSY